MEKLWKMFVIGVKKLLKKRKEDTDKIIEQHSKLTFDGIHKSHTDYYCFIFKQNEALMDKPIYSGFAKLELTKLDVYETN